jgi:hypothetical protein
MFCIRGHSVVKTTHPRKQSNHETANRSEAANFLLPYAATPAAASDWSVTIRSSGSAHTPASRRRARPRQRRRPLDFGLQLLQPRAQKVVLLLAEGVQGEVVRAGAGALRDALSPRGEEGLLDGRLDLLADLEEGGSRLGVRLGLVGASSGLPKVGKVAAGLGSTIALPSISSKGGGVQTRLHEQGFK